MYHPIAKALQNRRTETLTLASDADIASIATVKNQCFANVSRWVLSHPGHKRVDGWLVRETGEYIKHAVVETDRGLLIDVTPRNCRDENYLKFVRHIEGWPDCFDGLPPLVFAGA
jgi:hypothetical protein